MHPWQLSWLPHARSARLCGPRGKSRPRSQRLRSRPTSRVSCRRPTKLARSYRPAWKAGMEGEGYAQYRSLTVPRESSSLFVHSGRIRRRPDRFHGLKSHAAWSLPGLKGGVVANPFDSWRLRKSSVCLTTHRAVKQPLDFETGPGTLDVTTQRGEHCSPLRPRATSGEGSRGWIAPVPGTATATATATKPRPWTRKPTADVRAGPH